jgi:hypothetical protein
MASLMDRLRRYQPDDDLDFNSLPDDLSRLGSGVDPSKIGRMPQKVKSGALLPLSRYDDGSVSFDPSAGIVGSAVNALSAPYRAVTGQLEDPESEALNMAGWLMGGGFGRAVAKPAASAELGMFGGKLAKTADLTAAERRARYPWLDYDVPEADQIVRFGNDGPQMSVEKPPLPMDFESRMARAKAMGFDPDMTWSHYSPRAGEIDRFDPSEIGRNFDVNHGYHFTDDATIGAHYGDSSVDVVLPHESSMVNINLSDYEDDLPMFRRLTGRRRLSEEDIAFHSPSSFFDEYASSLETNLPTDKLGYIIDDGKSRQAVVFDNTKIRKPDAAFDPDKIDSADLLAAGSPLLPLMPREKKQDRR